MKVEFTEGFREDYRRIKDRSLRERIWKALKKLEFMPECGKPLMHDMKGHRRLVVAPFRLIYRIEDGRILVVNFEHRKSVYK